MITLSDLQRLQKINDFKKSELVDINDIKINTSQPIAERMENYISSFKNPYFFMCGEIPVILSFSDDTSAKTLSKNLQEHFIRQKQQ